MDLKRESSIQSPFLRLFLLYYGNFSLQLRPVKLYQWQSILNLAWNLTISGVMYYVVFCYTRPIDAEKRRDERLERVFLEKPLFAIVFKIGLDFIFHLSFLLTISYFVWISINIGKHQELNLVALLDTFRVDRLDAPAKAKLTFAIALLCEVLAAVATFLDELLSFDWRWTKVSLWSGLLQLVPAFVQAYILNLHLNMPFMLVLYYKYATLEGMKRIVNNTSAPIDIRETERQLRALAALNRRLGHLLSLPLLISIFNYTLDYVITVSCVFIHPVNVVKCIYLAQFIFYPCTIAYIDQRIATQLRQLATLLRAKCQNPARVFKLAESLPVESSTSAQIRCREMFYIYERDFRLKLFDLCRLDLAYISSVAFFIVNYVVLIAQTTV